MNFQEIDEFGKDFKKLLKRFRTLEDDMAIVKKVLEAEPKARPPFSFKIEGLGIESCVIKVKKIACRALKGRGANSGMRLIYAHFEAEQRIVLIEIYFKGDKDVEDKDRIKKHFK